MRESISVIFFISIPLTVFFMLEAKNSILLLGGNEYVEATVANANANAYIADFWFFKYHRESDFNPNGERENIL